MNRLDTKIRAMILSMLCEGSSMRATSLMAGASINTVAKLLVDAGKACADYHDETVKNVKSERIQCDEIWSFTYAKDKNVKDATAAPDWAGDTWTWTALDADSKLIIGNLVGGRDGGYAMDFMQNVADRVANGLCVQITTDGLKAYLEATEQAFGAKADFAQLIKLYGPAPEHPQRRYSPPESTGIEVKPVLGAPDPDHISTNYVERHNLTMRMRRFTRLTNGFSKKLANHCHMVALYTVFYNFIKIHNTLKVPPAMEAGLTSEVHDFEWLVEMMDSKAPAPKKRGTYKRRRKK